MEKTIGFHLGHAPTDRPEGGCAGCFARTFLSNPADLALGWAWLDFRPCISANEAGEGDPQKGLINFIAIKKILICR